jgi:hypothetical protein
MFSPENARGNARFRNRLGESGRRVIPDIHRK